MDVCNTRRANHLIGDLMTMLAILILSVILTPKLIGHLVKPFMFGALANGLAWSTNIA